MPAGVIPGPMNAIGIDRASGVGVPCSAATLRADQMNPSLATSAASQPNCAGQRSAPTHGAAVARRRQRARREADSHARIFHRRRNDRVGQAVDVHPARLQVAISA